MENWSLQAASVGLLARNRPVGRDGALHFRLNEATRPVQWSPGYQRFTSELDERASHLKIQFKLNLAANRLYLKKKKVFCLIIHTANVIYGFNIAGLVPPH